MEIKIVCPAQCSGGYPNRIKRITQTAAGITPKIARAARIGPHDELFTCLHCGCVWRRDFDIEAWNYSTVILGEYYGLYSPSRFLPELWVQRAMFSLEQEAAEQQFKSENTSV
jgi:hypothetical protein